MKWLPPWEGSFPAVKIFGNLYFVGTKPASTHIIDTGEGLIMLDSGYQHSLYNVIDGIPYVPVTIFSDIFGLEVYESGNMAAFGKNINKTAVDALASEF